MTAALTRTIVVVCLMACASGSVAAGDAAIGRELAKPCVVCHGRDGMGNNPMIPNIAGQSEQYLEKQLKDFRAGRREDEQMSIIARELTDPEIANLAAWYASIEFTVTEPDN
jgi:cytochrome c553